MRTYAKVATLLLLPAVLLLPLFTPVRTQAANCTVDESNEDVDAGSAALTIRDYGHAQGFRTETINRIKSVRVFLRNFTATQNFTVTVMKLEPAPAEVGSISGSFDPEYYFGGEVNPNSWMIAEWSHGDGLEIEPNEKYAIYLESDGAAMWARSGYNAYTRGPSFKYGVEDAEDDFGFMVCGSYVEESTSTSTVSTTSSVSTASTTSTSTTSTSSTTSSSTSSIIGIYDTPILTSLTQNGEEIVGLDELYTLSANETDTLLLTGQGAAEKYIVVTIGDYGDISDYIDSDGIWQVEVSFLGISSETLTISAYVTDDEGNSSDTIDFFDVEILGASSDAVNPILISAQDTAAAANSILPYIIAAVVLGVLGIIVVIVVVIVIKKRSAGKGNSSAGASTEVTKTEEVKVEKTEEKSTLPTSEVPPVPTV